MDSTSITIWLVGLASAALSGVGLMVAGWFRYKSDTDRTNSDDRTQLTEQLMQRVKHLEEQRTRDREYYEARIAQLEKELGRRKQ